MVKVLITRALREEIFPRFRAKSAEIFLRMKQLEEQPSRGKALGNVCGIVIKELKYEKFGFYFVTDGHVLKFGSADELSGLLIKFVRMSGKKDQQKTLDSIRNILKSLGFEWL